MALSCHCRIWLRLVTSGTNAPQPLALAAVPLAANHAPESPAAAAAHRTCCSGAGCSTSLFSISVTAHAHFVVLMGFGVLPIVPIVQAKTALPWFGHAQIVLQAQALREGCGA